jgi:hypothetical protein
MAMFTVACRPDDTDCVTGTTQTTVPVEGPHSCGAGVGVTAGVGVGVGVLVGVPGVGVLVGVKVGVAVGHTVAPPVTVALPFWIRVGVSAPKTLLRPTRVRSRGLTPEQDVPNLTVARSPLPDGPSGGGGATVRQPKRTFPTSSSGGRQVTLRPVLPRNGPFVTEVKLSTLAWKESSNS